MLAFLSCKKDKKIEPSTPTVINIPVDTSYYVCKTIQAGPAPFGWRDSTTNSNQNINTFMFNPANPNEVILVVNGDGFGFNKMYSYNIPSTKLTYIATVSDFPPSINKYGWVLFSNQQNSIYKVKANGDSLTLLSISNTCKNPQWDSSGINFYYYQGQYINVSSQIILADANGKSINSIGAELPFIASFHKTGKMIYMKTQNNSVTLFARHMASQIEKPLITGPYNPNSGVSFYDNLTLDNDDNYFYWSNTSGIFRCSLASLAIDTVLKNCDNVKYDNPVFQSIKPNELLFSCHIVKPINVFQLLHSYKAIEYNLLNKERTELKVFP